MTAQVKKTAYNAVVHECRGAVFAEMALVLVLVLPLFAGVVKVSLVLNSAIDLIQASRLVTRSSFHTSNSVMGETNLCDSLTHLADSSLLAMGLSPERYSVSVTLASDVVATLPTNTTPVLVTMRLPDSAGLLDGFIRVDPFPAYIFVKSSDASELGSCERIPQFINIPIPTDLE
jgi:hypothetical protein